MERSNELSFYSDIHFGGKPTHTKKNDSKDTSTYDSNDNSNDKNAMSKLFKANRLLRKELEETKQELRKTKLLLEKEKKRTL